MWEYKTLYGWASEIDKETNDRCKDGWEVFAAHYTGSVHVRVMRKWLRSNSPPPSPPTPQEGLWI
jgi:hypothetical protein